MNVDQEVQGGRKEGGRVFAKVIKVECAIFFLVLIYQVGVQYFQVVLPLH